jgi:hypothetical protein
MSTKESEKEEGGGGFLSRLGKGIKDLVVEDDGSDEGEKPKPVPKPTAAATAQPMTAAPPAPYVSGAAASDPAIRAILEKDVQVAAAPALTALDAMCGNLASVIPDEGQRIKAGLAAIKPQGHTFDAVVTDVDECLQALDKKSRENEEAAQAAIREKVGAREAALGEIDKSIADKRAQIEQLQRDITELEGRKVQETSAIAVDRQKIESKNASFNATVAAYRAELVEKKRKITAYGKGN